MQVGKLIVLTGPSGVGKGTLVRLLRERLPELYLSVSATTRPPRSGEVEGKDYYFVSRERFESMVEAGEFLEWAEYTGNYYGTPRFAVEEQLKQGKWVILEIEVVGAKAVKESFPEACLIFILPPSWPELEERLRKRGKDSEGVIRKRLARAEEEITLAAEFDLQIVNDDLGATADKLEKVINQV